MRAVLKWALRAIATLILAVVVIGFWKREEITRLWAVNNLFAEDRIVANFSNMERAFLTVEVPRGDGPVSDLPRGPDAMMPEGLNGWIDRRAATSLLVLKGGEIVHESYFLGTQAEDRRIGWSMAKSLLSVLFGILLEEGKIGALDDQVTQYAPQLKHSAYDGSSILNVLQMTSGVSFDEDYLDYNSDINRMGRVLALGGTMDGFAASLTHRDAEPGARWHYVSIDTHVLGMVIRGATGRDLPTLLSEKVIIPLGFEQSPYYLADGNGVAFALGGLNLTTRDYARFGMMAEQMGRYGPTQIAPKSWLDISTQATAPTKPGSTGYGYQWWIPKGDNTGEFYARGIYGQYIYIDRLSDVVIVATSADRRFRERGVNDENIAMFRAIAASL